MVFGALGSLASRTEDAQSVAGPVSVVLIAAYFVSFAAIGSPDSGWATAASRSSRRPRRWPCPTASRWARPPGGSRWSPSPSRSPPSPPSCSSAAGCTPAPSCTPGRRSSCATPGGARSQLDRARRQRRAVHGWVAAEDPSPGGGIMKAWVYHRYGSPDVLGFRGGGDACGGARARSPSGSGRRASMRPTGTHARRPAPGPAAVRAAKRAER